MKQETTSAIVKTPDGKHHLVDVSHDQFGGVFTHQFIAQLVLDNPEEAQHGSYLVCRLDRHPGPIEFTKPDRCYAYDVLQTEIDKLHGQIKDAQEQLKRLMPLREKLRPGAHQLLPELIKQCKCCGWYRGAEVCSDGREMILYSAVPNPGNAPKEIRGVSVRVIVY